MGNLGRESGHAQSNMKPLVRSLLPDPAIGPLAEFAGYTCHQ